MRPRILPGLILFLVIPLVAASAILLFVGLDQGVKVEETRVTHFIRSATFNVVDNLGIEVLTLYESLTNDVLQRSETDLIDESDIAEAALRYADTARFPQLLEDLVCVYPSDSGYVYRLLDANKWQTVAKPDWVGPTQLDALTARPDRVATMDFSLDEPVLLFRVKKQQTGPNGPMAVLIHFNANFLLNTMIPALVSQSFSEGESSASHSARVFKMGIGVPDFVFGADLVVPVMPWQQISTLLDHYRVRLKTMSAAGIRPDSPLLPSSESWISDYDSSPILPDSPGWYMAITMLPDGVPHYVESLRMRDAFVAAAMFVLLMAGFLSIYVSAIRLKRGAEHERVFMGLVSHELKTPLAVIGTMSDNLATGVVSEESKAREYGEIMKEEVARLSTMIGNILSLTAIQGGGLSLERVEVPELVREVAERLKGLARSKRTTILIESEPGIPAVVGNAQALHAAIDNLLSNAVRHGSSPEQDRIVEVFIRQRERRGLPGVEIAVRDEGPGVRPSERKAIFRPFYRGADADANQTPGSGVGLSLVRATVEALKGSISISKTKPTVVSIWLREFG